MSTVGKKHREAKELIRAQGPQSKRNALELVIKTSHVKFDEAVDADIVLGIDASKGEQTVRGTVLLPHGTGKKVRIIVFARGEHEEEAQKAGADFVGLEDLIEKISQGWLEFDVAIATPDVMGVVGKVAKILGPRGLLPNAKVGTVTFDVASTIKDLKGGRVAYRNDKGGVVHASFGKVSFGSEKLAENLASLIKSVNSNRPSSAKGTFIKKVVVSSTMGPGVTISSDDII